MLHVFIFFTIFTDKLFLNSNRSILYFTSIKKNLYSVARRIGFSHAAMCAPQFILFIYKVEF